MSTSSSKASNSPSSGTDSCLRHGGKPMARDNGGLILLLVGAFLLLPSIGHFTGATHRSQGVQRVMGGPQGFRGPRDRGRATDEGAPPDEAPPRNGGNGGLRNGGNGNGGLLNGLVNGHRPGGWGSGRRDPGSSGGDLELGRLEEHFTGASKRERGITRVMGGPQGFRRTQTRRIIRNRPVGGQAQREM